MRYPLSSIILFIALVFIGCFPARVLKYNIADINDLNKFDALEVANDSSAIFHFYDATNSGLYNPPSSIGTTDVKAFDQYLSKGNTVAFIVIRNDSILYEKYFDHYEEQVPIPSFSVSKSFVSALIGIAINEGHIKSIDEPISNYIPEFEHMNHITIAHVIDMQAGFVFGENYFNPFAEVAKYYYGRDLNRFMKQLKAKEKKLGKFNYQSVNTQVLAEIIERATGKSIAKYLEEKIWKPLQMEYPASWSIDDMGNVKAFCCINARSRDFAKLGRLYLNDGKWEGKQIVPKDWVDKSLYFDEEKNEFLYSNHWWHNVDEIEYSDTIQMNKLETPYIIKKNKKGKIKSIIRPAGDTFARGVLGQYIYIHPEKNIIIVRLGKGLGYKPWSKLFRTIAEENS